MSVLCAVRQASPYVGGDAIESHAVIEGLKRVGISAIVLDGLKSVADHPPKTSVGFLTGAGQEPTYYFAREFVKRGIPYVLRNVLWIPGKPEQIDFTYLNAAKIVCQSQGEKEYIQSLYSYIYDDAVAIIKPTIRDAFFVAHAMEAIIPYHTRDGGVIMVAGLHRSKGIIVVASACQELGLPLTVVGYKSDWPFALKLFDAFPWVNWQINVRPEVVASLLLNARVFVLASFPSASESTNSGALEAYLCGCNLAMSIHHPGNSIYPYGHIRTFDPFKHGSLAPIIGFLHGQAPPFPNKAICNDVASAGKAWAELITQVCTDRLERADPL